MGGSIRVESIPDKGSTFHFTAEFKCRDKTDLPLWAVTSIDLKDQQVLIVDDNATNRMVMREMVKGWGMRHLEAEDAETALTMLEAHGTNAPIRLILLDMQMPEMDGFCLAETIRQKPQWNSIRIIMLTSCGQRGDAARCRGAGIEGYLIKPVRKSELFDTVNMVLSNGRGDPAENQHVLVTRHSLREKKREIASRILLVEDDAINRKVAVNMLQKAGHETVVAENGQIALDTLEKEDFDLVLMDIQMPVMDGITATRTIRSSTSAFRDIPIIAMTAHALSGERERLLAQGMDDYISKPINIDHLYQIVDAWGKRRTDSSVESEPAAGERDIPQPEPKGEVINLSNALKQTLGNRELLMEILEEFAQRAERELKDLRNCVQRDDAEGLKKLAHRIKGASANICIEQLSASALSLEKAAGGGQLQDAESIIGEIEVEFTRLAEFLTVLKREDPDNE